VDPCPHRLGRHEKVLRGRMKCFALCPFPHLIPIMVSSSSRNVLSMSRCTFRRFDVEMSLPQKCGRVLTRPDSAAAAKAGTLD
jgi:hypothetical protein